MSEKFKLDMTDAVVRESAERLESIFRNNGLDPKTGKQLSMKDAMDINGAAFLIPRVLTQIVQEGVEPMLIGTSLLQKIDYVEGMQTVFPALDVLTAREVGDGMGLPIFNINIGGGQTYGVNVQRHGLMLKISERFIKNSTYPWLQLWLKLAGNALARHKEEFIFSFITGLGTVIYDNDPTTRATGYDPQVGGSPIPLVGCTTGRNYKGQYNGSMVIDDVFEMYAQIVMQGYIPDTMLVHPMTWLMWVKDPVLREFAIQAGGGSFFAQFTGNPAAKAYEGQYNYGGLGQGLGQFQPKNPEDLPQNQKSAPVIPFYGNGLNFRIMVSPFMRFNADLRTTDIIMFNSKNLGALITEQEPHVRSFDDPQYDLTSLAIEEKYGFGILNEGQAIAVAKNVKIRANEFVLPARAIYDIAQSNTFENDNQFFGADPLNVNDILR